MLAEVDIQGKGANIFRDSSNRSINLVDNFNGGVMLSLALSGLVGVSTTLSCKVVNIQHYGSCVAL